MNTTNISQKGNKASFTIEGVSHHYANTLRRMMIDLVPTLAIENVGTKSIIILLKVLA